MSYGEQLVWDALRAELPGDWIVMHSLWLKEHQSKQHAEIDFLVITDRAVLILEVKGGVVYRDEDGRWHYCTMDRAEERVRDEGPFDQARSAFYAVRNYLESEGWLTLFQDRIWGYGVILPQCILQLTGPDPAIKPQMLLDERAFPEGICPFINDLTDYWMEDNLRMKEKNHIPVERLKRELSPQDRTKIRNLLRPMLRPVQGVAVTAREAELELIVLTKEQCKALDFHDPDRPLILQGAAGTGKTMIAMEQIHRQSLNHNRLLFVCFNKKLAAYVRKELGPEALNRGIDVLNYHQLLVALNNQACLSLEPIEDWRQFNSEVEERTLYALQALQRRGTPFIPYDYLVLDEGQDLMTAPFLGSLELLIRGGWKHGAWTMCIDPRQIIFQSQYDEEQYLRLKGFASICPLNLNCRNTREIAAYAHGLSRVAGIPTRKAKGPLPKLVWYPNQKQFSSLLRQNVNKLIDDMSHLSRTSRDIVILTVTEASLPAEILAPGYFKRPVKEISTRADSDVVQCGTLQSFKGLEAMAVVLIGLEDLDALSSRQLTYVGGTRAKSFLQIFLPENLQSTVQERLPEILALLNEDAIAGTELIGN